MVSAADAPASSSNSCSTERGALSQVATSASICLILALGLLLNVLALWVFCCRLRRWTETRVYMVNLAAADCLLLLSLLGVLHTLGQAPGAQEGALCRVLQSFYYINTYMSMWLLTAIAADCYTALHFPLRARAWRSPRQAALTCAALWVLVIVAVALPAAWLGPGESFCFGKGRTRGRRALVFSLLLFVLPLVVVSFCSGRVLRHLLREWAQAQPQATAPILKALCVVTANLATFVLCFLPLHVALLAQLVAQWTGAACPAVRRVAAFVQVASRIANANCCLDAVCYYFVATEFQEEVGAVLARPWPFGRRVVGAAACGPPDLGAQERAMGGGPPELPSSHGHRVHEKQPPSAQRDEAPSRAVGPGPASPVQGGLTTTLKGCDHADHKSLQVQPLLCPPSSSTAQSHPCLLQVTLPAPDVLGRVSQKNEPPSLLSAPHHN